MSKLSKVELHTALALSSVVGLRMFGLFLIMPVFSVYALKMPGATAFLVGLAIGIYGFAQALLQVPVGLASDRFGRHKIITTGLLVFALGSIIAAMSHNIHGIIIGRVLQGMGAVSGASQALAADHSLADNRNKVMGIIGVSIGFAFILAIILSAPLAAIAGLEGLFSLTAILAFGAIALLWWVVPKPGKSHVATSTSWKAVMQMVIKPELVVLNFSIFMMHIMLTSAFVVLPMILVEHAGLSLTHQWMMYLPVMLVSVIIMGAVLRRVTSLEGSMKLVIACAASLGISILVMGKSSHSVTLLWLSVIVFFASFNLLEATLPSLVSRLAPGHLRGAGMGAYATSQFLGAGIGGMLGGLILGQLGQQAVLYLMALGLVIWLPLLFWGRQKVIMAGVQRT